MTPQEIISEFVKMFTAYESRKMNRPLGDNLNADGMLIKIYPDGSGKIVIDTQSSVPKPDATASEKLIRQIFGGGEMDIDFENAMELAQILTGQSSTPPGEPDRAI